MSINENQMHRLSFSKFIFNEGEKHCNQTTPNNSIAILHLHDSVDIYIQLLCEIYDKKPAKPNPALIDLINSLNPKFEELGKEKINVPFFNRLNTARNRLKHESMFSTKIDIIGLVSGIKDFYITNTPIYFEGVDFNSISLVNLIRSSKVKESLLLAQKLIETNNFNEALVQINKGFGFILYDYTTITNERGYREKIIPSTWFRSIHQLNKYKGNDLKISGFPDFEKELKKSFDLVAELIAITNLGIDFQSYARFRKYHLEGFMSSDNEYIIIDERERDLCFDEINFCFDFVLENALK